MKNNKSKSVASTIILIYLIVAFVSMIPIALETFTNFSLDLNSGIGAGLTILWAILVYNNLFFFPFAYLVFIIYDNHEDNKENGTKRRLITILNIIDVILSFMLFVTYPFTINYDIYRENKGIYYGLGAFLSIMPIIYTFIKKYKIDIEVIKRIAIRVLMLLVMGFMLYTLNACSLSNIG